ncbi:uncharacterized protein LOC120536937 isoform X2 [Polypterus senegalus]|uniref:uncharacterized protein LOC120536937 isoform X2 n=1 Tax=Polypterus senegalus TaxID=55291 RepID=UPI0019639369|nr:uncharacterized protein LOC120536937 isoform X2 [Polypterus senegalus]
MEKYLEQLVEVTKSKMEGDEHFQQQLLVKTERNSNLLDEMTKSQHEGTHQLQQLILEMEMNKTQLTEMNKAQKEGNHQLQQLIQEMNKKQQEETVHLKQQFLGMQDEQREILNVLHHLQQKISPRVIVEEVPSISTKPVEDSSASGDSVSVSEAATGAIMIQDSDTDDEETSKGGVAPANERRILPSQTVKSFTIKSSGTQKKVRQDFLSEAIEKLFRENKLPIICKKTKGILNKNKLTKTGSRSVLSNGVWFFAGEFEILSGWKNSKNWKKSIYIDMEEVKKNSNGPCGQNNCRRIYLYDFFKQIKFVPALQQVDKSLIRKYQHLFQP